MKRLFLVLPLSVMLWGCSTTPLTNNSNYGVPALNRTIPERMIDEGIKHTVIRNLSNVKGLENMDQQSIRVVVDSFQGQVLLTGEIPSEDIKGQITQMVSSMKDVKKVHNYLVATPTAKSPSHTAQENFLKSKVLARLVANRVATSPQYKIIVRSDVVYVIGHVNPIQQNHIIEASKATMGIAQVVLLATLVNDLGETLTSNDIMTDASGAVAGDAVPSVPDQGTVPVVQMQETPTSSYVQLYNGTSSP